MNIGKLLGTVGKALFRAAKPIVIAAAISAVTKAVAKDDKRKP